MALTFEFTPQMLPVCYLLRVSRFANVGVTASHELRAALNALTTRGEPERGGLESIDLNV
jgi:hypothetical protein